MTLLRRTATALFALALLLLALVQLVPFADRLQLLGRDVRFSYAVLTVLAFAAAGGALNLADRPKWAGALGLGGVLLASTLVVTMGGLRGGGTVAVGFGMYLGAAGCLAAAGLMAFGSILEERRHGPLPARPRLFRASDEDTPAADPARPAPDADAPANAVPAVSARPGDAGLATAQGKPFRGDANPSGTRPAPSASSPRAAARPASAAAAGDPPPPRAASRPPAPPPAAPAARPPSEQPARPSPPLPADRSAPSKSAPSAPPAPASPRGNAARGAKGPTKP